jgi:apolipoprotein N-acyltransferase
LLAALLLWLSFPPIDWSLLAWFALVPLAVLIRAHWQSGTTLQPMGHIDVPPSLPRCKLRSLPIYRPALAGGLLFSLLAVQWIRYADDSGPSGYYGWWALAFYMSLYFPLFLLVARMAVLRFRVPIILAVPTVWVGLEYLRSWLITGFPWYYLGHTQYESTRLIQIADWSGAYGVSFLVALVNGWIVELGVLPLVRPKARTRIEPRQLWRLVVVVGAIAGSMGYGAWRLRNAEETPGPRVAIMQTSVPQRVKEDEELIPEIHRSYWQQLAEAIPQQPQLVIWPETAYRYPLPIIATEATDNDLKRLLPDAELEPREIREFARRVKSNLVAHAERTGVPNLMGINTEILEPAGTRRFNSAFLIYPTGELSAPYHKIHLVPWGEYLPLRDSLPWLRVFTPHASADYGLAAGTAPLRFTLHDWTFGVLICFEDTVPSAARAYVSTEPVDFLVNISNDGWFGVVAPGEAEASMWRRAEHDVHMAISVFRTVECRRPLVRAVNTGISAIIDSSGRILKSSALAGDRSRLASQVIVGDVPLDRRESIYSRTGDWLGVTTFTLTILTCFAAFGMAIYRRAVRVRAAAVRGQ